MASWRTASCASSGPAGTTCTWPPRHMDLRDPPPSGVHLHVLGRPALPGPAARLGFMWRMRRLWHDLGGAGRFDLVHQLNPVDVGLSLALADVPVPVVLGPYVPDWPHVGAGRRGAARSRRGRHQAPPARRPSSAGPRPCCCRRRPPPRSSRSAPGRHPQVRDVGPGIDAAAWAARPGARPGPPGRPLPGQPQPAQGRPRGCSTRSPAWPGRARARGSWWPGPATRRPTSGAGVAADPALARRASSWAGSTATRRARRSGTARCSASPPSASRSA